MVALLAALAVAAADAQSPDEESGRIYRTREEQREAGLYRKLTPWLSAGGLLELELERQRLSSAVSADTVLEDGITLQLGLHAFSPSGLNAEALFEYDSATGELRTDEVTAGIERDLWELVAGWQYLPFGVFVSHFATGPMIEFGETRATGADISYDLNDRVTFSLSAYQGAAYAVDAAGPGVDWVLAVESHPLDALIFAASFISDLADANERPLVDQGNRYVTKVPGASALLAWIADDYEISLEALGALRSFADLDADRNRPRAWNFEFAYFLESGIELALRLEGSRELEDAPSRRIGAGFTVRPQPRVAITMEYLYGRFKGDLAVDEEGNPYSHENRFAAQVSVVF
jgi:hypothetical protein